MRMITLLKKMISLSLKNGAFLKLTLNLYVKQVGFNLLLILSIMLKLLSKLTLSQKLMKKVAYLIENALMTFLIKDTVFCILA